MLAHKGTVTLEISRLILQQALPSDAEDMFCNCASDAAVTKFRPVLPGKRGSQRADPFRVDRKIRKPDFYQWMIVQKELKEAIGTTSMVNHRDDTAEAEIGYCFGKTWWHWGICDLSTCGML